MARVQTFLPFDQTIVDFNALYWGDSTFYDNTSLSLAGRVYQDASVVTYDDGELYYLNIVAGNGLRANGWGEVVSGNITGLFQAVGLSSSNYYDQVFMTGISVSGAEFYRATSTQGSQDDQALIRKALAGNDRFDLGDYDDRAQGHGGHDAMYGNGGNDTLEGGAGKDSIRGGAGHDRLFGGTGDDHLWGGAGSDRLHGGIGNDWQHGGAGADVFVFSDVAQLGRNVATTDTIADFTRGQDKIDLSGIDAMAGQSGNQAFTFIGRNAIGTSARGEVSFQTYDRAGTANDVTVIRIDTDADRDAEAVIRLAGIHGLTASDFIL
ncbi:MAG: M10 family metallopeptidase C-terminal domain-containing protein [Paracoccus sp. (in: a-proteobacteria)]|uniref:M10 family metallopeptidase C-terminal domain-containing protein n=1 Tax=Paracoccus sp. TaxID=267 RepID=UPI0039E52833